MIKEGYYIDNFCKEKDLNKHTPLIAIHPGTRKKLLLKDGIFHAMQLLLINL